MNDGNDPMTLIRRYVDGELPDDERRALEERLTDDPRLAEMVEAERALKTQVASMLGGVRCPDEVATRVRAALADATDEPETATAPRSPRRDVVASPFRANIFAIAASLALVAAAVLWGIFGRQIDNIATHHDPVAEAATFVSGEHGRCAGSLDARIHKAAITDRVQLRMFLQDHLGSSVPVFDLADLGYDLKGGGECMVPGHPRSGHMLYVERGADADGRPMVSVFVVPDTGQFDEDPDVQPVPGRWYEAHGDSQSRHMVLRSTDGALMYFLVCCKPEDLDRVAARMTKTLQGRRP